MLVDNCNNQVANDIIQMIHSKFPHFFKLRFVTRDLDLKRQSVPFTYSMAVGTFKDLCISCKYCFQLDFVPTLHKVELFGL